MRLCCLWPPREGESSGMISEVCDGERMREGSGFSVWCVSHWCLAWAVFAGSMLGCSNIRKAIIRNFKAVRKPRAIWSRRLFLVVWKGLWLCQRPEVSEHGSECSQIASPHFKELELFLSSIEFKNKQNQNTTREGEPPKNPKENKKQQLKEASTHLHTWVPSSVFIVKIVLLSRDQTLVETLMHSCLFFCVQTDSLSAVSAYHLPWPHVND